MSGTATWETQIELDIEELKKRLTEAENEIQSVVNKPYKVELDLDTKTLESAIKKLDKMLTSLGKGTNDFKQFETLSKDIESVSKEIQSLSKAFGKIDDSGTKTLLQSIQSIDTSLSKLSEHILDVNHNMGDIGGNTSGAVKQAENIRNANEEAAKSAEKLADAQARIGDAKKDTFQSKKDKTDTSDTDAQVQKNKELNKAIEDYKKIKIRIAQGKAFASDEQDAENLLKTIDQIMGKADGSATILSQEQLDAGQKKLDEIDKAISNIQSKSKDDFIKSNEKQIERLESQLKARQSKPIPENQSESYKTKTYQFDAKINEYKEAINELRESGELTEENKKNIEGLRQACTDTAEAFKQMSAAQKGSTENSRWKEIQKISKYLDDNTRLSKEAREQLNLYLDMLKSGDASVDVGKIHTEWLKISEQERIAGREGKSFIDTIKEKTWYSWAGQIASMFSGYDLFNWGKQAASIVTTLNTNITDLAKVSEATTSQIYADFDSYADIAKDIGGTISDTITATAAWAKNGYNIPDSKELARVSQLYKNVGDDIDIDSANESLISTLKGFQLEADQAEHIIDVFNEVSNNEAISSSGIGEALQRSAASFNAANTTLEQSVALVTATNSVLQDPDKVGCKHIADYYSNVIKIKVAISVNVQKWIRPRKDLYIFKTHQLGRMCFY